MQALSNVTLCSGRTMFFVGLILTLACVRSQHRAYESILSPLAVNRLCGMDEEPCLTDFNCCPEYECYDRRECRLRDVGPISEEQIGKRCITNYQCTLGLCCRAGHCVKECGRIEEIPDRHWNRWQRGYGPR
ncbi:hypothetical protein CSKR_114304 [Clonorchis sinensis]|uniref:Uncharacterized protein n=2 Tax=Clonorchis sinensis TaxID=79923 RepID=G7YAY5_CLOSI|nr:hypothetical protein CSKR_114304 [Clonorchis sinensis]GAA50119.1 hypothetical protein CLF_104091 [Clonorchis sinensis]